MSERRKKLVFCLICVGGMAFGWLSSTAAYSDLRASERDRAYARGLSDGEERANRCDTKAGRATDAAVEWLAK